jgi:hypothetical protein
MNEHIARRLFISISDAIQIAHNGKSKVRCPHCNVEKELPVLPLSPVIICTCIECNNYVIPFAGELLALPKYTVESGHDEDRKWAIVQVIMKMLHEAVRGLVGRKIDPSELGLGGDIEIPDSI